MKINNIRIKNVASFRDFYSDTEFAKTTLFFGTNGSGKSTIASVLQLIDRYQENGKSEIYLNEIKEYISNKISKEAANEENSITIDFNGKSLKVDYEKATDSVNFSGEGWYPIKVFNDRYTELTVGKVIDIDLQDSGLIIGEPNRLLDSEQKKLEGLIKRLNNYEQKITTIIDKAKNEYSLVANSQANVSETISVDRLKKLSCEFINDETVVEERKKL